MKTMKTMKTLNPNEEEFFLIQIKNPGWSSHTCFLHLIRNKKYTYDEVEEMFNLLVDENDYKSKNKEELIDYAFSQVREIKPVSVFKKAEEYRPKA